VAQRTARLKRSLSKARRTADQTQASFLKAEDALTELEGREQRRADREPVPRPRRR